MIVGDNRFGLVEMLNLAEPMGMGVVSVEYRLAPETPHPGPVEDCYPGLVLPDQEWERIAKLQRFESSTLHARPMGL